MKNIYSSDTKKVVDHLIELEKSAQKSVKLNELKNKIRDALEIPDELEVDAIAEFMTSE